MLRNITRLGGIPSGLDQETLYQLLLARETLACTGIGRGIALPHPRDPLVLRVRDPHVLLCLLAEPVDFGAVDFGAVDGEPIRALFLLLAPSVQAHLQLLAKLAFALHDDELLRLLGSAEEPKAILDRIGVLEGGTAQR